MSHQIVPTRATALIARKILADTHEAGADAVLRHIDDLEPTQYVALVAILAKAAADKVAPPVPGGKPLKAIILTEDQRRRAHTRYTAGHRDAITVRGEREYQRERKRASRAARNAMHPATDEAATA